VLAEFSEKDEPEVKEDEPTIKEIEDPLPKVREVISDIKSVETNMNVGRSMWNARLLAEFNQSSWIQVDFAPLINYRRKEERRHIAKQVEDIFDQEMSGESIQNMFETEREEDDEAWIDRFDNSNMIYDEEREGYNRDEPSDSKDKWEKIGLKLEVYSLCAIEALKDRLGDQRGGSEWEPIKILLKGDRNSDKMNSLGRTPKITRSALLPSVCQNHVAPGVLLVIGTTSNSNHNTHAPTTAETTRKPAVQRGQLDRV
jgi:hypothetical protein